VALDAIDLEPPGRLLLQLSGSHDTLKRRAERLLATLPAATRMVDPADDVALWHGALEFGWARGHGDLTRAALSPRQVPGLQRRLERAGAHARYSLAANLAWIAWPSDRPDGELDGLLRESGAAGMRLTGRAGRLLGPTSGAPFAARVRGALDPQQRFLGITR
jgi:hypothetical protein